MKMLPVRKEFGGVGGVKIVSNLMSDLNNSVYVEARPWCLRRNEPLTRNSFRDRSITFYEIAVSQSL